MDSARIGASITDSTGDDGERSDDLTSVASMSCDDAAAAASIVDPDLSRVVEDADETKVLRDEGGTEMPPPPSALPGPAAPEFSRTTCDDAFSVKRESPTVDFSNSAESASPEHRSASPPPSPPLPSRVASQNRPPEEAGHPGSTSKESTPSGAVKAEPVSGSPGSCVEPPQVESSASRPPSAEELPSSQTMLDVVVDRVGDGQPASMPVAVVASTTTTVYPSSQAQSGDKPLPPKKPLTPYMRFSKSIWQQVKAANPVLSVCEVGAAIGRMWREMEETDKQRYNDDFASDKVRYDGELQSYLRMTGLQASDLARPKAKRKDAKDRQQATSRQSKLQPFSNAAESCDQSGDPTPSGSGGGAYNGSTTTMLSEAMQQVQPGFQTGGEECIATALGSLPQFSQQMWAGQELFAANQQLLAQMGVAGGGGQNVVYANHAMNNNPAMMTMHSHEINQTADGQVAALYSQNQSVVSSQQMRAQCLTGNENAQQHLHQIGVVDGMSNSMTASLGHPGNATALGPAENAWLWQQYNAGNQDALAQASGSSQAQATNEGVIIYQLTSSDGSTQQGTIVGDAQNQSMVPMTLLAKQTLSNVDGSATLENVLEPGEVPLSGQLQENGGGGGGSLEAAAALYDMNQLYSMAQWGLFRDDRIDFAGQAVDGEKQLLRSALLEKTKEIQRLTRELEQAYGLIHQLKQQNDFYQRHWNGQQQQQQQQTMMLSPKMGCAGGAELVTGIVAS